MTASALAFHGTTFDIIDRNGQPWLRGPQIGDALGYQKAGRISIHKLYEANAAEFTASMTAVIKLPTAGGMQDVRIFSLRGAHLLGMFARTAKAAEFRRWVLDVLEAQTAPQPIPYAVLAGQTLSAEQAQTLRDMLQNAAQRLPQEKQGAFMVQGWSKLKAHFKTDYRHIPAAQFADAACLLARHISDAPALPAPSMDEAAQQLLEHLKQWQAHRPARLADLVRDRSYDVTPRELREIADACFGRVEAMWDAAQQQLRAARPALPQ